jgi:hypothetical protein
VLLALGPVATVPFKPRYLHSSLAVLEAIQECASLYSHSSTAFLALPQPRPHNQWREIR